MSPTRRRAAALVDSMRDADRDEVRRAGYDKPAQAIADALRASDYAACAVDGDGNVLAIWGLVIGVGCLAGCGHPWALTSVHIEKHKKLFMRTSLTELRFMLSITPNLSVLVDYEYKRAHRWLRRLGFGLSGPVYHPTTAEPFYLAAMES